MGRRVRIQRWGSLVPVGLASMASDARRHSIRALPSLAAMVVLAIILPLDLRVPARRITAVQLATFSSTAAPLDHVKTEQLV